MQTSRYPKLYIRSKNELAKHLSHSKFPKEEALALINDTLKNFNKYWKDNEYKSEPEKEKFVRSAKGTPLGRLLDNINKSVLAPHDKMLPVFIFGGVKNMNHAKAAKYLLGRKRKRTSLKLDIARFFEQISEERVYHFLHDKCACSKRAAKLLAGFCCVPKGHKGSGFEYKTIARGFATSSRLAIWCNLDTFIRLDRLVQKRLKGKDARIAIYVDDIGITASRVSKEEMKKLSDEITKLLLNADRNQRLPINEKKTKISSHEEGIEHLGLRLYRNRLSVGAKTKSKIDRARNKSERKPLIRYKHYVEKI